MRLGASALHLLHLSLCLRFVHALTDQYIHQQNLLLTRCNRGRCVFCAFVVSRLALDLQVLPAGLHHAAHLSRLLLSERSMHVMTCYLHLL